MDCWVSGCNGEHDKYMHPKHNCPLTFPRNTKARLRARAIHKCSICGKEWKLVILHKINEKGKPYLDYAFERV